MADLEGTTIAATYRSLLNVGTSSNQELDATLRVIEDGAGNDSVLYLATDSALISGNATRLYFFDADGGEYIAADNAGNMTITAGNDIVLAVGAAGSVHSAGVAGTSNTVLGVDAGIGLEAGSNYNVLIGDLAGDASMNDATKNVGVGYNSLSGLTEGDHNVVIGNEAANDLTIGDYNTFIGSECADALTQGDDNVAIGYSAMGNASTTDGIDKNVFIGNYSGDAIGGNAVEGVTAVGYASASGALTSAANGTVAVGREALKALTSGEGNTAIGYQSLDATAQADSCTAIGYQALTDFDATNDGFHTFVGWKAGGALTSSSQNTGIGANAMGNQSYAIVGSNNVAVGFQAMTDAKGDMNSNIAIGANTIKNLNGGDRNIAIGSGALDAADNVESDNIAIGEDALGQTNDNGALKNIAIGSYCMDQTFGTSYENTMIGYGAGGGAWEIAPSIRNTAVGYNCMGGGAMNSGNDNTAVGHGSLDLLTTGNDNACFGSNAGNSITTGSSNVMIGVGTDCGATDSNQVAIGIGVVNNAASQFRAGGSSNYLTYDFSSGGAVSITSDKRIKKDIRDGDLGLDFVNGLRPIKYVQKNEFDYPEEFKVNKNRERPLSPTMVQDGFIAQDVKSVADELGTTFSGWTEDANTRQELQYSKFVVPLVKAIQELSAKVKALEDAQ